MVNVYVSVPIEASTAETIANNPQEAPVIMSSSWSNVVVDVIVVDCPSPTNEYQTPKLDALPKGAVSETEFTVVPANEEAPHGSDVALEQASFVGGVGIAFLVIFNVKIPQVGLGQVSIMIKTVPAERFPVQVPLVPLPVVNPPKVFAVVGGQAE